MKSKVVFSGLFLLFLQFGVSQSSIWTVPIQVRGNLILFFANINGQTGYVILDTGIETLTLNSRYFRGEPTNKILYSTTGQQMSVQETHVDFAIGGWSVPGVYAEITDLQALEIYTGLPVFANLGTGLFRHHEIVLDYIFQELTIYQLDGKGRRLENRAIHQAPVDQLSFRYKGSMPVLDAVVGTQRVRLGLDTGASVNIWNERSAGDVQDNWQEVSQEQLAGFGDRTQERRTGLLVGLGIGRQQCPPMKTAILSLDRLNQGIPGCTLDGLLGYEFLARYRTSINFLTGEILLWDPATVEAQYLAARK